MRIRTVDPAHPEAKRCLQRYFSELDERFDTGFDLSTSIASDHSGFRPPSGRFLIGETAGRAVACGGLYRTGPDVAYIKRMWVDPDARGMGLGRRMLEALEASAREMGCGTAQLETHASLETAIRLYRSAGYREVAPFNDEPYAHYWFEKRLDPASGPIDV